MLERARGARPARARSARPRAELLAADEVFITSSLKELVPVRTVDGAPVGGGRPGPVTLRLLADFRAEAPAHCG